MTEATLRECPDCGLFQTVGHTPRGCVAECLRCSSVLHRARSEPMTRSLALSIAGLALFAAAVITPLLDFRLGGQQRDATLLNMPSSFELQGLWELDLLVLGTIVVAPCLNLVMTVVVLLGVRSRRPSPWLPRIARWREQLRPWAMTEVFLLGALVAYTRLAALASVEVGVAMYALGGLMVMTVASDALLDHEAMWDMLGRTCGVAAAPRAGKLIGCETCGLVSRGPEGGGCPRCGAELRHRRPNSLARSSALLSAAALCYVPANVYPILTVIRVGQGAPSTILGGAEELLKAGMWPLALLVFAASIAVPMFKLAALAWMIIAAHRGSAWRLRDRTRLYRVVDAIGRWSMIDVFMLTILAALVQMGFLASVIPDIGAAFFAGVVVLTMLAAFNFDPRLMWDRAAEKSIEAVEGSA